MDAQSPVPCAAALRAPSCRTIHAGGTGAASGSASPGDQLLDRRRLARGRFEPARGKRARGDSELAVTAGPDEILVRQARRREAAPPLRNSTSERSDARPREESDGAPSPGATAMDYPRGLRRAPAAPLLAAGLVATSPSNSSRREPSSHRATGEDQMRAKERTGRPARPSGSAGLSKRPFDCVRIR
jgi:hypothetical protein